MTKPSKRKKKKRDLSAKPKSLDRPKDKKDRFYPIYRTIVIPLKAILKDYSINQPIIDNYVCRAHQIVTLSYQFIRLYCLDQFEKNQPLPQLDHRFCYMVMGIVSNKNEGKPSKNEQLKKDLITFYDKEFSPLLPLGHSKPDFCPLSSVLQTISVEMQTSFNNNIAVHFLSRLRRWLTREINDQNLIPQEENESKKAYKKRRYQLIKQLWNGLWEKNSALVPSRLSNVYQTCVDSYLPTRPYQEGSLGYDLKANTDSYLLPTLKLNVYFEQKEWKLFQPLSLRTSSIPKHIPINMKSLVYLMDFKQLDKNKAHLIANAVGNEDTIWEQYFNLNHKIFSQKPYTFYHRIDTDGVKCSVTFILSQYRHLAFKPKECISDDPEFKMLTGLTEEELIELKDYKLIGGDPGKKNMIQLVTKDGRHLKYTSAQRWRESSGKKNRNVILKLRKKMNLEQMEKELNIYNSKTVSMKKFKEYLKKKMEVDEKTWPRYKMLVFRKIKMRGFIHGRRSIDKFIDRIGKTFCQGKTGEMEAEEKIVIGWGNWCRNGGMKGCEASMGKGLRRKVEKKYRTVTVDEYHTSQKCHWCKKDLINKVVCKKDEVNKVTEEKSLYRCLICNECQDSESKKGVHRHINRDINAGLNIWECLSAWINERKRPLGLERPSPSEEEKTG